MRSCTFLAFLLLVLYSLPAQTLAQVPWVETAYPGAALIDGQIVQVEVDDTGNIYGLTDDGTLLVTTDRGESWTLSSDAKLIGATGLEYFNGRFYVNSVTGLYRSSDLETWEKIELGGLKFSSISSEKGLLIAKQIKTEAIGEQVKYYLPSGATEFILLPDSISAGKGALTMAGSNELRYLTQHGYWKSAVGSTEWQRISDGLPVDLAIADMAAIKDSLYVGVLDADSKPHLYATRLDRIIPRDELREMFIERDYRFTQMYTADDSVLVALRKSPDKLFYEIHWTRDRTRLSPPFQMPGELIDLSIRDGKYYLATGVGIFESSDFANTWQKLSVRIEANVATHLLTLPNGIVLATSTRGFLMLSNDGGASWAERKDLGTQATMLAFSPAGTLFVGVPGQLLASKDLGQTFLGSTGFEARTPLSFASGKNGKLFLGTDSGMYYSTDDGASWIMPASFNMPIVSIDNFLPEVYSIAVDRQNDLLFLGTRRGVILTPDEGEKYINGWIGGLPIYSVIVDGKGGAFAGTTSLSSSDINDRNFYFTSVIAQNPDAMEWYGTDFKYEEYDLDKVMMNSMGQLIAGMLFSYDGGRSWEMGSIEGRGSPKRVDAQAIDQNDIAYVSIGDKVYKSAGPKLNVSPIDPKRQELSVYPNPAANSIRFAEGVQGDVTLYNALGESVLSTRVFPSHSIDIRHLPAGSYICQLTSSAGLSRMPLVVVR
jgi:photosystem II stability/assembly factor-like uncharacterized protein